MTNTHKSTRVGDLLVEKGVITREQLLTAIELQQTRRHEAQQNGAAAESKQELGELLIELGFINRQQLSTSLSLQKRLRKTTAVMVFLAPLLTAACGGGGGGGGGGNTTPSRSNTESSLVVSSEAPINQPVSSAQSSVEPSSPVVNSSANTSAAQSKTSSSHSSRSTSSLAVLVQPPSPKSSSSVPASPPTTSFSSSSASSKSVVNGPVQVYWVAPNQRENGDVLDITEIGGYELRYKKKTDHTFTRIIISDGYIDAYYFDYLQGEYEFQIAAFDAQGHYSAFENLFPM